ncbi:MAG TPA: hypothetical protein VFE65_30150 [Pseudonocardia sp.]|jgi:hypothetical protein|nr:hypothetical protein [Pseudonocardia sp.]
MTTDWPPIGSAPSRLYPPHTVPAVSYPESPDKVRFRAALDEALTGVQLGAYDERILDWVALWDTPTVAVIASLLHRARQAGRQES